MGRQTDVVPLVVEEIAIRLLPTSPPRVGLAVTGRKRADAEVIVRQDRTGSVVVVTLVQSARAEAPLVDARESVMLEGSFPRGSYRVLVNGIEQVFSIP
jgi:hypothetical protein